MKNILVISVFLLTVSSLFAQSNQRFVVFEHFTNTTCPACGNKNPEFFEDIYEPYLDDLIHVEFHHNAPVEDLDPFNLFNQAETEERFLYYGSPGQPRMFMNGTMVPVQTGQPLVPVNTFTAELGQTSPIAVEVSEVSNGLMRNVTVEVHTLAPVANVANLVLRVGVVEKYILYPTYFESEFHNVFREWLNGSDGTDYLPAPVGSSLTFNFSYTLDPQWQSDEIYTIAYVQDNTTKEIINGGKSLGPGSTPALNAGLLSSQDILCPGDMAMLEIQASGGCPPYTYEWSDDMGTVLGLSPTLSTPQAGTYTMNLSDNCGGFVTTMYDIEETPPMQIVSNILPETDNDSNGSIEIIINGGTAPYTYIWSTGASEVFYENLSSGVYNLTIVDDNGCSLSQSITVPQLTNTLSLSYTSTPACLGLDNGTVDIDVQGGNPPYAYNWANGYSGASLSGLAPGNYIVVITDGNGFEVFEIINISEITYSSTISTTADVNGDSNGSANIFINSAYPFQIIDDQGTEISDFDNLEAGDYSYFIDFGNGCTEELNFSIDELNYEFQISDNLCFGDMTGEIAVINYEPSDMVITWFDGSNNNVVSGLNSGNYCVAISNGTGTTMSECLDISSPALLSISETIIADSGTGDGSISILASGGVPPYSYSWSTGENSEELASLSAGSYELILSDSNGCSITESFTIDASTGLVSSEPNITIYPNPSSEIIKVESNEAISEIKILDAQGRVHYSNSTLSDIDISDWNNGVYLINIQTIRRNHLHKLVKH